MSNVLNIDDYDLREAREIASSFGNDRFGYVVTPNVDHVIRHYYDAEFRTLYAQAAYVFLDSHFLGHLVGLIKRRRHRVTPGSDLTATLMSSVIKPHDKTVLVGGTAEQAQELRERFGFKALQHIDPPMNFIRDEKAVEACLREIEAASPFRFCFLAFGTPQQEIIALKLKERGVARFEWLYRLARSPKRLAKRYLVRGPRIFLLLPHVELRLRRPVTMPGEVQSMPVTQPISAVTGTHG
jgi:UDP-N-acetyl-D-mannosaminuronic acid transferase (WecB/TagA/CpsF family)